MYLQLQVFPCHLAVAALQLQPQTLAFTFVRELTWKPLHFLNNFRCSSFDQRPFQAIVIAHILPSLLSYLCQKSIQSGLLSKNVLLERSTVIADFKL